MKFIVTIFIIRTALKNATKNYLSRIKLFGATIITKMINSDTIDRINKECDENKNCFIYILSLSLMRIIIGPKHFFLERTEIKKRNFIILHIIAKKRNRSIVSNKANKILK